ncbi:MAG TPA: prepilin peptidase [Planctomycetota bacterium]|nr:prepilin peptidase [Planctomycetota bacterium]
MPNFAMAPVWFWILSAGCFGAILGSFVNMAAYRLPRNISTVTRTRSFCPKCNAQLAWYENLPILSYLFLRGKCGHCGVAIPIRYLLTEVIVAALFCLSAYQFFGLNAAMQLGYGYEWWRLVGIFVIQLFLIVDLVLLSVVDLELWLIPWETTLLWIPIAFIFAGVFPEVHAHATYWTDSPVANALIDGFSGAVIGAGALWSVGFLTTVFTFLYYRWKKRPDRPKEGMGLGDVHLMALVGALLGWKPVVATLFLAVFIGSVTGIAKILWDKYQQKRQGENYKPWQPTFELPQDEEPYVPSFWPMLLIGLVVLLVAGWMFSHSSETFQFANYEMAKTLEERKVDELLPRPPRPNLMPFDVRLFPTAMLLGIGLLLVFSFPFFLQLKKLDLLPQGSIVEKDTGEKEEVLHGNYVPFGPSLALAALIVAFYDPVLRNVAWWFYNGSTGPVQPPSYDVPGQTFVTALLVGIAGIFKLLNPGPR